MSVERVAINVDDARIADNAGWQPVDEPVAPAGPAAYLATVPIKAMVAAMREADVPAQVSNSAGTFVCNHGVYGLQHALADTRVRSGFVHGPYLSEQAAVWPGAPSLPLATMVDGVREALRIAATHVGPALKAGGGAID